MIKTIGKAILLVFLTILISCVSKKNMKVEATNQEVHPKLIFLNYSISKESNGKNTITFLNKTITDGKLKSDNNKYIKTGTVGDLECLQLNKDSKEIASVTLKNPLSKHIEFINDSLIFENKKVELSKATFSLRLQLDKQTKFIAIKQINDSLYNKSTLIITKIDQ